jgi:two-component system, chemotaxis family, sensor kinase CheA
MFITRKQHEREKQELVSASNRITDAILANADQGLFILDSRNRVLPQISASVARLFRRDEFANLTFEKLLAPVVTAKVLSIARNHIAQLLGTAPPREDGAAASGEPDPDSNPLSNVEIRLPKADGSFDSAHYSFDFSPFEMANEQRAWIVSVTDITQRVQTERELEELRVLVQTQGEILRSVLHAGAARFAALLHRADASMKTINTVLKKPAREQEAFRNKLEEALEEVDRVRRDAAAFQLSALEASARVLEDALHDLRSRASLSGSDFLPLAVKLDQLYGQFALLKSLGAVSAKSRPAEAPVPVPNTTVNGTQVIESPKFMADAPRHAAVPGTQLSAPAGSLENTLRALTDHVAQEHDKTVTLQASGLALVPAAYQSAIKNIAIQLIRNAVMHGIEPPATRVTAGKSPNGTMRLEFKSAADGQFELLFEDDGCGLNPETVRTTAIARGIITGEGASRLRDREAIKLIFKSGYSTLPTMPGEPAHGTGLALVRRYVHEADGKVALASLLGHETRFKVTLPPLPAETPALELERVG